MNKVIAKIIFGCLTTATAAGLSATAFAQGPWPLPPAAPAPAGRPHPKNSPAMPDDHYRGGDTYEKSIAVAPNVSLTLCVVQANLRINGWSRNEVRIFIKNGSNVGFRVREKSLKDQRPVWISAIGYDKKVNKSFPDCVWGETIEIDVPESAALEISGKETEASIDTVRNLSIKNGGGDISVRNVSDGVTAVTYEGDIEIEASRGQIYLETTSGNITAFEIGPSAVGDRFKAKTTGGAISLQGMLHRQVEANSVSGSLFFNGGILSGGSYIFSTSNGSIRLALPKDTSCQISAVYGYGSFASEIPFKIETENISPGPIKRVAGRLGTGGDATVKLTTNIGSISIKKN